LLLLEDELAVVHDLADRRIRRGGDLDQVEVFFASHFLGLGDRNDSDLFSFEIDQTHLGGADHVIDAIFGLGGSRGESWITAWWENTKFLLFLGPSIYGQPSTKSTSATPPTAGPVRRIPQSMQFPAHRCACGC